MILFLRRYTVLKTSELKISKIKKNNFYLEIFYRYGLKKLWHDCVEKAFGEIVIG